MHVWRQILHTAWENTWEIVVGQTGLTIMVAALIFVVVFVIARWWRGKEFANDWLFESIAGACAVIVVFGIVFLIEALIVTPIQMVGKAQTQIGELTNTVASLTVKNTDLVSEKGTLQKMVDKDEAALKAVSAIGGTTSADDIGDLSYVRGLYDKLTNNGVRSDLEALRNIVNTTTNQFLKSYARSRWEKICKEYETDAINEVGTTNAVQTFTRRMGGFGLANPNISNRTNEYLRLELEDGPDLKRSAQAFVALREFSGTNFQMFDFEAADAWFEKQRQNKR